MLTKLFNFLAFQSVWLITCFSAAAGQPFWGPLALLVWLTVHFSFYQQRRLLDFRLLLIAAVFGYLADSILVISGLLSFPPVAQLGQPSTLWMVSLWAAFALTLPYSLAWLQNNKPLALTFGIVGGPLAYFAGSKIGAISIDGYAAYVAIAVEWLLAMLLLLRVNAVKSDQRQNLTMAINAGSVQ